MKYWEIAAFVGDADIICEDCARAQWCDEAVDTVIDGEINPDDEDYTHDHEGNAIGVVFSGSEALTEIDAWNDARSTWEREHKAWDADLETALEIAAPGTIRSIIDTFYDREPQEPDYDDFRRHCGNCGAEL